MLSKKREKRKDIKNTVKSAVREEIKNTVKATVFQDFLDNSAQIL